MDIFFLLSERSSWTVEESCIRAVALRYSADALSWRLCRNQTIPASRHPVQPG